jgi:hypothetical protein
MKTYGKILRIKEQVYKDASGITFKFLVDEGSEFPFKIFLFSDELPFGNRELVIDKEGMIKGGGSVVTSPDD